MKGNNQKVIGLIRQMTMDEKLNCLHGQIKDKYRGNQAGFVKGVERLGIPNFFIADGESGVNVSWDATLLPAKVGLAASFDRKAAREYGEVLGKEAKAMGMNLLLTPRVNIVRDYAASVGKSNGGNYQTYGEDPILNGQLGAEEAMGIQKDSNAMANAKQMFGASTGAAQGAGNCIMDQQTIHQIYMKPFEAVIKAGCATSMSNYNQVNGIWTYDSVHMHKELARDTWRFEGFTINDWYCLFDPNAIQHGVSLEMPGEDNYGEGHEKSWYGKKLVQAAADSKQPVTEEDIDQAVYYYLDTLDRFQMLGEQRIPGPLDNKTKRESAAKARMLAGKTAVLLKNEEGILPIHPRKEKIAIIGPTGNRQAIPIFKESSYGFKDRLTGTYQVLAEQYGEQIAYSVGNDLDGEVIPAKFLKTEVGGSQLGLKRYVAGFVYDTLGNGELYQIPQGKDYVLDEIVDYKGKNGLPPLKWKSDGNYSMEMPRPYYNWHGVLCPQESGEYRLSLQSVIPGADAFEKNQIETSDMFIGTSGNIYIKMPGKDYFDRLGIGTRIAMNGGAVPNSEVVPCMDGYNNAGATVFLEAGMEYEIYFNHCCIYQEPVHVRLAWRTPTMACKAVKDAVEIAKTADKVILFAWHKSPSAHMKLHEGQNELIEAVTAANSNTVVVLNTGDPIEMPWIKKTKGLLEMWFSGQEGALATVDVLLGNVNPGGKLPITFPKIMEETPARDPKHQERYAEPGRLNYKDAVHMNTAIFTEGIMNGYRWFDQEKIEPQFPFGFGMSYTTFNYRDMNVKKIETGYEVSCKITNIGDVYGEEVVQCYLGKTCEVPMGVQVAENQLVDFDRIYLEPGETKEVKMHLDTQMLQYYEGKTMEWVTLNGTRKIRIGASSRDMKMEAEI